jgi:glycosyltransferase involved in cell wall biosynthesis
MAIAFVLHEATRTGAPRLGALIARELQAGESVHVLVMKDGPLAPWLRESLGPRNVTVCPGDPFYYQNPFEARVRLAAEMLEQTPSDIVYVNSLAASVFALAGAALKRKTILHVHEKSADMANLLLHDVTKLEVMRVVDAFVLAADDIRADLADVFRFTPVSAQTFGVAVDIEAVRRGAEARAPAPVNTRGQGLVRGERLVVGMSGHASLRKGADVFFDTAAARPEHDFLWVGGWRPEETIDNIAYEVFERAKLPNLYIAGAVDNPYAYMAMMDVFFLSSREDPNPLVIGEALALSVPVLAFAGTTGVAERLGRWAILCYGKANAKDAARALGAMTSEAVRRPSFRNVGAPYVADYDLKAKMGRIAGLIRQLRGEEAEAAQAVQRTLEGGVVELTFS